MAKRNETAVKATVVRTVPEGHACGLVLTFASGEQLTINPGHLTQIVLDEAVTHGLKQKLVDAAAIPCNPDTGRPATAEEKYAAVKRVYDRLMSGSWNMAAGEGGTGSGGLLYRALCKLYDGKKTPAEIRTYVEGLDKKQQAALRDNPKIKPIIDELREKDDAAGASGIDSDELLAGLDGGDE